MRIVFILVSAVFVLAGCDSQPTETAPARQGRYLGVGVYSVGNMWSRMKASVPADKAAATLGDENTSSSWSTAIPVKSASAGT